MKRNELSFFCLFLFAIFSVSLLQGMIDPDLFWHIRAGSDILESGKIVLPDSWNYLYEGSVWVNQQWLIEVIFALLYKTGGISAIFYFKAIFCALIGFFIFKSVEKKEISITYISTAIVIALIARYFLMRTQALSFLFLAVLIYILEKASSPKKLFVLIPLFALWANVHAFFGLGLFTLGMYIGSKILSDVIEDGKITSAFSGENLFSMATAALSALATFINPFGIKIFQTAGSLFTQRQETLVSEWLPVWKYPLTSNWMFFVYFGLLIFLGIVFSNKIKFTHIAISAPLIGFGLYSVRILPFSVIATAPLFASLVEGLFEAMKLREKKPGKALPYVAVFLAALSMISFSYRLTKPLSIPDTVYREDYPLGATAYMKENGLKGKIFNEFDWGGYIVFSSKDFKTAIDGRTAVLLFPRGYLEEWRDTVDVKKGWMERLEKGSPDFALLFADDFLSTRLSQNGNWELLYADSISALFGRKRPPAQP